MITINLANKNDFITEVNLDDEVFFTLFLERHNRILVAHY